MTDNKSTPRKGKPQFTLSFLLLSVTFCVCIIVANLIEIKAIDVAGVTLTAGMIIFPLSYIINDCLVEVYGFRKARIVIWLGFAMNLFVTLALQLAIILPGSADWTSQDAMEAVYGGVPRILFAFLKRGDFSRKRMRKSVSSSVILSLGIPVAYEKARVIFSLSDASRHISSN